MKWKIILGVLCFLLIGLPVHASDDMYIVKFNNQIQIFNKTENATLPHRKFSSVSYEELQELLDMGVVEYYEPDCEVKLFEDYYSSNAEHSQWNLSAISIEKAWDIGCYGNDVKVAVIDSGIYNHPDLKNKVLQGYNYIDNSMDTTDNIGHGTYVSGIIATECNDEYITGIAHQAKIVPLKCFDNEIKTTASMIANAIYDAIDIYDCDVINMSFGMDESLTNRTLQLSVAYAIQNGCIVVASVGNDGSDKEYYPAKYDNVIGVGSINESKSRSWFSQYNNTVDIVAPGEVIQSVSIEGYNKDSGTSFSAPHISAIAAIVKCIDQEITTHEFMRLIETTSTECEADTNIGYDFYYGYGIVNVEKIVDEVLKETPVFLSPITNKVAKVYNNSDSELVAKGIVANYTEKRLLNVIFHDVELLPGKIQTIDFSPEGALTKVMLWDSLETITPLYQAREYKSN